MSMPAAPPLEELPLATAVPERLPALEGYTFEGYRNPDGSVGTKNLLGIATTVQCVAPTVDYAVRRIQAELLPRFPNVDGAVAVTHSYGCGVAIDAPGAAVPIQTLKHIGLHANMGGQPMIVSLGCEKVQPARLFGSDLPVLGEANVIRLQDERGFAASVAGIMEAAEKRLEILNRVRGRRWRRRSCGRAAMRRERRVSGVTCNPAVGFAADLLVRAGATVLFSEVTEVRDAIHLLTPRAETPDVARALIREMRWYDEYLSRGGADRSANTTPGNKRGGLNNIVEKALGSIVKSGSTAIRAVASHGEKVTSKGLVFAATPASDFICGTQQLASMNLHVFTTGEGTPYGLAMVPVIKVSSRTALAEKWPDLIDLDAGTIATGRDDRERGVGVVPTDSGWRAEAKTWADHWGLGTRSRRSIRVR